MKMKMTKQTFSRYVHQIVTNDGGVRYAVAVYEPRGNCYYQYSAEPDYQTGNPKLYIVHDPTELLSYPTRRQALRHARYIYGVGGRLDDGWMTTTEGMRRISQIT